MDLSGAVGQVNVLGGSRLAAEAKAGGVGDAGSLGIAARALRVEGGNSAITVSSKGSGSAGNLSIYAEDALLTSGGQLTADTVSGRGGNIQIQGFEQNQPQILPTVTLQSVQRTAELEGLNRVQGSGSVRLTSGGEISTSTVSGQAGRISITSNNLVLDSGKISSVSQGTGQAGSIALVLRDVLAATNQSEISASSRSGGGGKIEIAAPLIFLTRSSPIISSVFDGSGGGGSISITATRQFFALQDSDILANAVRGDGGQITIKAPIFIADIFALVQRNPGNLDVFRHNGRVDISASSQFGRIGRVSVPDFSFLQNSLSELASNLISPDQVVADSCLAQRNAKQGSFVVTGSGGLPPSPYDTLTSSYSLTSVRSLGPTQASAAPVPIAVPSVGWKIGDPIEEAEAMSRTNTGRVVLVAGQSATLTPAEDLVCNSSSGAK